MPVTDQRGAGARAATRQPAAGGASSVASAAAEDGAVEFDERRAKMERLRAEGIDPYPPVTLWSTRTRIADVLAAHDPASWSTASTRSCATRSPAG